MTQRGGGSGWRFTTLRYSFSVSSIAARFFLIQSATLVSMCFFTSACSPEPLYSGNLIFSTSLRFCSAKKKYA